MSVKNNFYVYVYIDPRNHQEFYYGKGQGSRKLAHLEDESETLKSKQISAIKAAGQKPIIRVVASKLSEEQALLIEKTLIWKLGNTLTNISTGNYSTHFRPPNSLHKEIFGFDYENGIFYVNVGENENRNWDDCVKYSFMSAGQNWLKYGKKLYALHEGDIVCAYLAKHGYVGIGRITSTACNVADFRHNGKPLSSYPLIEPRVLEINNTLDDSEHFIGVEWIKTVNRKEAFFKSGIYSTPLILASLQGQPKTIQFLEEKFKVNFTKFIK